MPVVGVLRNVVIRVGPRTFSVWGRVHGGSDKIVRKATATASNGSSATLTHLEVITLGDTEWLVRGVGGNSGDIISKVELCVDAGEGDARSYQVWPRTVRSLLMNIHSLVFQQSARQAAKRRLAKLIESAFASSRRMRRVHDAGTENRSSPTKIFIPASKPAQIVAADDAHDCLVIGQRLGGGSVAFQEELVSHLRSDRSVTLLTYDVNEGAYYIDGTRMTAWDSGDVHDFLSRDWDRVDVNSLIGYPNVPDLLDRLAKTTARKLVYYLHDFFPACPSPHLLDLDGSYCGVPSVQVCPSCLPKCQHAYATMHKPLTVISWRRVWSTFFDRCDTIYTFSQASEGVLDRAFNGLADKYLRQSFGENGTVMARSLQHGLAPASDIVRVAVFGPLTQAKGVGVVDRLATYIAREEHLMKIHVYGDSLLRPASALVLEARFPQGHGSQVLLRDKIDVFLLPSIVPETYSRSLTEAMVAGTPVACFDIGAQAERAREYAYGHVLPLDASTERLHAALRYAATRRVSFFFQTP